MSLLDKQFQYPFCTEARLSCEPFDLLTTHVPIEDSPLPPSITTSLDVLETAGAQFDKFASQSPYAYAESARNVQFGAFWNVVPGRALGMDPGFLAMMQEDMPDYEEHHASLVAEIKTRRNEPYRSKYVDVFAADNNDPVVSSPFECASTTQYVGEVGSALSIVTPASKSVVPARVAAPVHIEFPEVSGTVSGAAVPVTAMVSQVGVPIVKLEELPPGAASPTAQFVIGTTVPMPRFPPDRVAKKIASVFRRVAPSLPTGPVHLMGAGDGAMDSEARLWFPDRIVISGDQRGNMGTYLIDYATSTPVNLGEHDWAPAILDHLPERCIDNECRACVPIPTHPYALISSDLAPDRTQAMGAFEWSSASCGVLAAAMFQALGNLADGGAFVLKIPQLASSNVLALVASVVKYFSRASLIKPEHSRFLNGELYLRLEGFIPPYAWNQNQVFGYKSLSRVVASYCPANPKHRSYICHDFVTDISRELQAALEFFLARQILWLNMGTRYLILLHTLPRYRLPSSIRPAGMMVTPIFTNLVRVFQMPSGLVANVHTDLTLGWRARSCAVWDSGVLPAPPTTPIKENKKVGHIPRIPSHVIDVRKPDKTLPRPGPSIVGPPALCEEDASVVAAILAHTQDFFRPGPMAHKLGMARKADLTRLLYKWWNSHAVPLTRGDHGTWKIDIPQ